jgi:hypothetical protein
LIENQRVLELPLNGRQVTEPAAAVARRDREHRRRFRLEPELSDGADLGRGRLARSTVYMMDGASHNDPGTNFNLPVPFPDALQEFRIETTRPCRRATDTTHPRS